MGVFSQLRFPLLKDSSLRQVDTTKKPNQYTIQTYISWPSTIFLEGRQKSQPAVSCENETVAGFEAGTQGWNTCLACARTGFNP